jgi:hypothetical protein
MKLPSVWRNRCIVFSQDCDKSIPSECIQFFKDCGIAKFQLDTDSQVAVIIQNFCNVVTELTIGYRIYTVTSQSIRKLLPKLTHLVIDTALFNYPLHYIPKLTSIKGRFSSDIQNQILQCNSLKELLATNFYNVTKESIIRLFKLLPLLEVVSFNIDGEFTSVIWNTIFEKRKTAHPLKSLSIIQPWKPHQLPVTMDGLLNFRLNLKCLNLGGTIVPHLSLLYASQYTLEELSISTDQCTINFQGVSLPNMKRLSIDGIQSGDVINILILCNDTLEELKLSRVYGEDHYSTIKLTLPKIKLLHFFAISSLHEKLLTVVDGTNLRDLSISSIADSFPTMASRLKNLRKLGIATESFCSIPKENLSSITELSISNATNLNEQILNLLTACSSLVRLEYQFIDFTAENWLVQLLNSCPNLQNILHCISSNSNIIDFSNLQLHHSLYHLIINYESIQSKSNLLALLKNVPNLKYIRIARLGIDDYSDVLEALNEYPVSEVSLSIQPAIDHIQLSHCNHLSNSKVKKIHLDIQLFSNCCEYISMSDCVLVWLCILSKDTEYTLTFNCVYDSSQLYSQLCDASYVKDKILEVFPKIQGGHDQVNNIIELTREDREWGERFMSIVRDSLGLYSL